MASISPHFLVYTRLFLRFLGASAQKQCRIWNLEIYLICSSSEMQWTLIFGSSWVCPENFWIPLLKFQEIGFYKVELPFGSLRTGYISILWAEQWIFCDFDRLICVANFETLHGIFLSHQGPLNSHVHIHVIWTNETRFIFELKFGQKSLYFKRFHTKQINL